MLKWVSEVVMPSPTKQPAAPAKDPPPAPSAPAAPPEDALVELVNEVMVHVAEGRLEMAALMMGQAEAALAAEADSPRVAALRESHAASRVRLEEAVRRQLRGATGPGETARCCKLLCLLGRPEEAFALLRESVAGSFAAVATAVRAQLEAGNQQDRGLFYVESASRVFSAAMDLVADHQGLLLRQFGAGRFFEVAAELQRACDKLFALLFERFLERRVRPTVARVAAQTGAAGDSGDEAAGLGQLLDEMTKLSLRCEIWGGFVDGANREALEYARGLGQADPELQRQHNAIAAALAHSLVRRGNLEAMSNYVLLELRFLEASLRRTRRTPFARREALERLADAPRGEARTRAEAEAEARPEECGFVDPDAYFFVLDRSCQRALSGRSVAVACSVLAAAASALELDLPAWLAEAWEGPASRSTTLFCQLLERTEQCAELCRALQGRLDAVAARLFSDAPAALAKVHSCLEQLGAAAARRLHEAAASKAARHVAVVAPEGELGAALDALERLPWEDRGCAARAEPLVRTACDAAGRLGGDYTAAGAGDAARGLVGAAAARWVAGRLEGLLSSRRFSQSGAVALEAAAQSLGAALRPLCPQAELRAAFDRLRHCCTVLAVEAPGDLAELWDALPLSIEELRAVASRRVDFTAKDIAALRFPKKQ
jgi:hypothetical protein